MSCKINIHFVTHHSHTSSLQLWIYWNFLHSFLMQHAVIIIWKVELKEYVLTRWILRKLSRHFTAIMDLNHLWLLLQSLWTKNAVGDGVTHLIRISTNVIGYILSVQTLYWNLWINLFSLCVVSGQWTYSGVQGMTRPWPSSLRVWRSLLSLHMPRTRQPIIHRTNAFSCHISK